MVRRKLRNAGTREQAWLGALIGGIVSAAGAIGASAIQNSQQRKLAQEQKAREDENKRMQEAFALSNSMTGTNQSQLDYQGQYRVPYSLGGNINKRPKKFLGAALMALGSAAYSLISAKNASNKMQYASIADYYKAMGEQNREEANNLSDTMSGTTDTNAQYQRQFAKQYKKGGRRKLHNTPVITDGGYAIPIDSTTSLLQGSSHQQVNESGQTGIGINVGGKEIEAEGGEIAQVKNGDMRIYSKHPMFNGMSPAEAVMLGYDKDAVFKAQEEFKDRRHLNDDGTRRTLKCGGSSPLGSRRKAWGGMKLTTGDYIGAGVNIGASILANILNRSAYDDLEKYAPTRPGYIQAAKLNTTYDINPQLTELERARLLYRDAVDRDTSSSVAALSRFNNVNINTALEKNKLWAKKENEETKLINADAVNQQEVAEKNAKLQQDWRDRYNTYMAGIASQKIDSNVGMIQGIASSVGNFLQSGIDNYQAEQARRMHLAASPYGSAERMASMGVDFSTKEMRSLLNNSEDRLNRYKNDNSESGIKSYNDALDSYNFWNDRLGNTSYKKYSRRSLMRNTNPNSNLAYLLKPTQSTNTSGGHWDWFRGEWVSD